MYERDGKAKRYFSCQDAIGNVQQVSLCLQCVQVWPRWWDRNHNNPSTKLRPGYKRYLSFCHLDDNNLYINFDHDISFVVVWWLFWFSYVDLQFDHFLPRWKWRRIILLCQRLHQLVCIMQVQGKTGLLQCQTWHVPALQGACPWSNRCPFWQAKSSRWSKQAAKAWGACIYVANQPKVVIDYRTYPKEDAPYNF